MKMSDYYSSSLPHATVRRYATTSQHACPASHHHPLHVPCTCLRLLRCQSRDDECVPSDSCLLPMLSVELLWLHRVIIIFFFLRTEASVLRQREREREGERGRVTRDKRLLTSHHPARSEMVVMMDGSSRNCVCVCVFVRLRACVSDVVHCFRFFFFLLSLQFVCFPRLSSSYDLLRFTFTCRVEFLWGVVWGVFFWIFFSFFVFDTSCFNA